MPVTKIRQIIATKFGGQVSMPEVLPGNDIRFIGLRVKQTVSCRIIQIDELILILL
jgi:hypothetical protein